MASRRFAVTLFALFGAGAVFAASAQTQSPDSSHPVFEVASIKPNKSGDTRRGSFGPQLTRLVMTNVTLRQLIGPAYRRRAFDSRKIVGGPAWIETDRFDVAANIPAGAGTMLELYIPDGRGNPGRAYLMLRALLEERFKLAVHNEVREVPIFALVLARRDGTLGPGLQRSDVDCEKALAELAAALEKTGKPPALEPGQGPPCSKGGSPGNLVGNDITMAMLADSLTESIYRADPVDRVVVDRTGLQGNFDVKLEWTLDELSPNAQGASIFTALQEQLGLKLEPARGPVDVLVVDRAERPTPD